MVAAQRRTDTAVTFCCSGGGPRQPWSSGLAPVSRFHSKLQTLVYDILPWRKAPESDAWSVVSLFCPPFPLLPVPNRPAQSPSPWTLSNKISLRPHNRAQELCESRGGRPRFPSLINRRFLWTESNTRHSTQFRPHLLVRAATR